MAESSTRPSKRFTMKLAEREAIFTYLPIRSEFTREKKSGFVKSISSTRPDSLAAR